MKVKQPAIIIGGGGHAKVVADVLKLQGVHIVGFTDVDGVGRPLATTLPYLGDDAIIYQYRTDEVLLFNGLGSIRNTSARRKIYEIFSTQEYRFGICIHPTAIIACDVVIGDGSQIMAGSVIQPGSKIGRNVVINTRTSIDHDCEIGDHVHVAPGVTLSGEVKIATGAHIGTGATVIQGINIGTNSMIGAGAVVVSDVADDSKVIGVPAREVLV